MWKDIDDLMTGFIKFYVFAAVIVGFMFVLVYVPWLALLFAASGIVVALLTPSRATRLAQSAAKNPRPTKTLDAQGRRVYHYYDERGNEVDTLYYDDVVTSPDRYRRVTMEEGWKE